MAVTTYNDFIQLPISEKVVLFELIKGQLVENVRWAKEAPGVWKTTYSWETGLAVNTTKYGVGTWGAGTYGVTSSTNLPTSDNINIAIIGGLSVGTIQYVLTPTLETCVTTDESFYWDTNKQILYINYGGIINSQFVTIGVTIGYANKSVYIEGIYYEGRLVKPPTISIKRDNLFNNKVSYEGGNVTLLNTDGALNSFRTDDVYGWPVKISYGSPDLIRSEFKTLYTGYLEKWDIVGKNMSISIKDERKNLTRKIPNSFFDQTTYPNLKNSNVGKAIPIGYGVINKGIAICTNEEETSPSVFNFKFIDTTNHDIESISQVYVDGLEVAHTNGSLTNGTFDLATSIFKKGQKVSITYNGYTDGIDLIDNPMDIIVDILETYASIPFTSIFYNTVDWDAATLNLPSVGLLVSKPTLMMKTIGLLSSSISGTFMVEQDGRFNMKIVNLAGTIKKKIKWNEYLESTGNPVQKNLSNEYISTARVGYAKDWENNSWPYHINNDEELALFNRYRSYQDQDFNTLLTLEADAATFSEDMMNLFGGIFAQYTFTTKMQNSDLEIEDIISVDIFQYSDGSIDTVIAEVTGISYDLLNHNTTVTCRSIDRVGDDNAGIYGIGIYGISIYGA